MRVTIMLAAGVCHERSVLASTRNNTHARQKARSAMDDVLALSGIGAVQKQAAEQCAQAATSVPRGPMTVCSMKCVLRAAPPKATACWCTTCCQHVTTACDNWKERIAAVLPTCRKTSRVFRGPYGLEQRHLCAFRGPYDLEQRRLCAMPRLHAL